MKTKRWPPIFITSTKRTNSYIVYVGKLLKCSPSSLIMVRPWLTAVTEFPPRHTNGRNGRFALVCRKPSTKPWVRRTVGRIIRGRFPGHLLETTRVALLTVKTPGHRERWPQALIPKWPFGLQVLVGNFRRSPVPILVI